MIEVGRKKIGEGYPVYIVAEIGFNHGGDIDLACKMIEAAAKAGADAVKFQTYQASNLLHPKEKNFELVRRMELSFNEHKKLQMVAQEYDVTFFSTAYSKESVDMLEELNVPLYKVASMDLTNLPLIKYVAVTGKPIIISTGMGTIKEISEAIENIKSAGNNQIILLHTISKYPTPMREANLRIIPFLKRTFKLPVGYSDHVLGLTASLASVVLGACIIEKHFTIDKSLPAPDNKISADPEEFATLVRFVREIEEILGEEEAIFHRPDRREAKLYRRSIFAVVDIPPETEIKEEMIKCLRPEKGLLPKYWDVVVNRKTKCRICKGEAIDWGKI